MSTRKSPFYTAMGFLFSLVILVGGAAKLYRGVSGLSSTGGSDKVRELLTEGDAAVEIANREMVAVQSAFQTLFTDFDQLGVEAFRAGKREDCDKVIGQYESISNYLQLASSKIAEATKLDADAKVNEFLLPRSKSYDLLKKVCQQNIAMVQATLDTSLADADSVISKLEVIVASRDADQKAADDATNASDAVLKRLQSEK